MNALFLALGATRRRSVTEDAAQVVGEGGTAVVVIDQAKSWARDPFAPGVRVVELSKLELRHLPRRIEAAVVFTAPKRALHLVGRGRLSRWATRASRAYERRVANPLHHRALMPAYGAIWRGRRGRLIRQHVLAGATFDAYVVGDPGSLPLAAELLAAVPVPIAYGLDQVLPAVSVTDAG